MSLEEVKVQLAVVENNVSQLTQILGKLDTTIEKMADISTSIKQLLAVHEAKLEISADMDKELQDLIETRRQESSANYERLHQRITTTERDLMAKLEALQESQENHHQEMVRKMQDLEKWRWIFVGGAAIIGWLLANIANLRSLF